MQDFSKTMDEFTKLMKERRLDQKLELPLKNPRGYSIQDLLSITSKLQVNHENCTGLNPCLRAIRKFFRLGGDHSSTLQAFLKLAPSESYGSVICGGIAMILAVCFRENASCEGFLVGASCPPANQIWLTGNGASGVAEERNVFCSPGHTRQARNGHLSEGAGVCISTCLQIL